MKKLLIIAALILGMSVAFGQGVKNEYNISEAYTAHVDEISYHSDCFTYISSESYVVSYYYCGVDNDNNLTLIREVYHVYKNKTTVSQTLTFSLDQNNSGEITLLVNGLRKIPTIVRLRVTCNNHKITAKYIK